MNAQPPRGEYVDTDMDVESTLVREHQLTQEAARRIRSLAREQGIGFSEAAIKLGLMNPDGTPTIVPKHTGDPGERRRHVAFARHAEQCTRRRDLCAARHTRRNIPSTDDFARQTQGELH